ncbi:hypothetical protein EW026_g7076 [Hermanssonia centrifuga]|uniref:Fungal-type protein kinase domain-containing protein n=1 Tax=Hermanssonia centrifuga TaxID=98765 RepID=A0A4S4K8Z7_9APHY|nr:hypothetical protein EW026_g7076 [Hermanssonia centrifuga]
MVLTSVGRKLTTADSIKDLLMAIYDIIEAHRSLCMDRSILHRDMSMNNILIYPQHDPASEKRFTKNPPKFISDVIRDKCKDSDRSRGLIIDFDNSASLLDKERRYKADQDLTCCVLTGLAKSLYVQAYSQQSYDLYADSEGQCHSVPDTLKTKDQCSEYAHRPDHDVESIFWSLIYVLLQLQPLDGEDSNVSGLSEDALLAWKHLHGHRVEAATKTSLSIDTRDVLFEFCAGDWNKALHPGLSSLAPLLAKMSLQVWPEYGLLAESPPREHLHEAMRRLLLQHIVDMDDPIPLNPRNRRPVPRNVDHVTNVTGVDIDGARFGWLHLPHPKEQPEGEKPKIILRVPAPKRRREGDENAEKPPDKRRKSS